MCLTEFKKEAPHNFAVRERPGQAQYKYCLRGKGCTLGVLFETSTHVCFEWLTENGQWVEYRPELRYKAWPKRKVARLVAQGWWAPLEAEGIFS